MARVLQGIVEGVMTGLGSLGAGVILRDKESQTVYGLTTAASVWVTAALVIACGLGAWRIAITGTVLTIAIPRIAPLDRKPLAHCRVSRARKRT